jgi:hypothetical protein
MTNHIKLSTTIQNRLKTLAKARLPELRAEYAQLVGKATRSPDRTFLLRKITEALSSAATGGRRPGALKGAAKATQTPGATTSEAALPKQRGRFAALSVAELQAKYREVVGRDTGSDDRGYLIWKIREAENGRVPVGPRRVHAAGDMTTLPFRIPTEAIDVMDEAWRARGVKSRNRFLQDAVGHYLAHLGEPGAATQFTTSGSVAAA